MSLSSPARNALVRGASAVAAVATVVAIGLATGGFSAQAAPGALRAAPVSLPARCAISGTAPTQVAHPSGVWLYKLAAGARLDPGQYCQIGGGGIIMQADGNLVVYNALNEKVWWTATRGRGHHALVQADGNVVVYNSSNAAVWSTYTAGATPKFLAVQTDGNVVLYNASWGYYWAADTVGETSGGLPPVPTPTATATTTAP